MGSWWGRGPGRGLDRVLEHLDSTVACGQFPSPSPQPSFQQIHLVELVESCGWIYAGPDSTWQMGKPRPRTVHPHTPSSALCSPAFVLAGPSPCPALRAREQTACSTRLMQRERRLDHSRNFLPSKIKLQRTLLFQELLKSPLSEQYLVPLGKLPVMTRLLAHWEVLGTSPVRPSGTCPFQGIHHLNPDPSLAKTHPGGSIQGPPSLATQALNVTLLGQ